MEKFKHQTVSLILQLVASIFGLTLIPVMVFLPNLNNFQVYFHEQIVGSLYVAVCFLGLAAAFYPIKCKRMFEKTQNLLSQANKAHKSVQIKGHHPDCQNYSKNKIKIGERVFCAACSGLVVGAIIALVGTTFYFFVGVNSVLDSIWLLVLGEIGMSLGLAQIWAAGFDKVILNVVFVVSSFITLAAVDAIGKSFFVDLYALALILFLLWFRISLSEWNNRQTCSKCQLCFS